MEIIKYFMDGQKIRPRSQSNL